MHTSDEIKKFVEKVKKMEKGEKLDLSSDEDLSVGIMNLISIEEHLFFSGGKTGNKEYYKILAEVRDLRKDLLKKIIKDYEGEVWCISKHLLAASMRLMEVGTKAQTKGDTNGAEDMFSKAYKLYSLFWGLNLGLIKTEDVKKSKDEDIMFISDEKKPGIKKSGIFDRLGVIVQKVVDCCKE